MLDPSALVITMLEKVGLARNVVRIAPERQHEREHQAGPMDEACQTLKTKGGLHEIDRRRAKTGTGY